MSPELSQWPLLCCQNSPLFSFVAVTIFWQEWKWIEKHGLHCFELKEINAKSYLPIRNSRDPTVISVFARLQFAASLIFIVRERVAFILIHFNQQKSKKVLIIQHWNSRSTKTKVLFPLTMLNIFYYTNFCVTTIWFGYFQIKKTVSFRVESNNLFRKTKINGLRHPELMNLLIFIRIYNCSGVCLCLIHMSIMSISSKFLSAVAEKPKKKKTWKLSWALSEILL